MTDATLPAPQDGRPYFVSNYPPYRHWGSDSLPIIEDTLQGPPTEGTPFGVYVHIPFCRKRCKFCYFKVYTGIPAATIQRYIEAVLTEARRYAQLPRVQGRQVDFLYVGGGTPSFLSASQLRQLIGGLKEIFPLHSDAEFTFECEPGTLRAPKVAALRELGVTRLSLGVENFDPHILETNGRAHRAKDIEPAYQLCRDAGFPQINLDLIAGMLGESDAAWAHTLERTLALDPDSVTIYQLELPPNTRFHRAMTAGDELPETLAGWSTRRRWLSEAFRALEAHGYDLSSGYTAVKRGREVSFVYRDNLWAGADLLPLGVSAFGHLGGHHLQNEKHLERYIEQIDAGGFARQRGCVLSEEHRLIRQWVLQLKLGHVDARPFRDRFGVDPLRRFAAPLQELSAAGYLSVQGDLVTLTRPALLAVDQLLPSFFLPEHGGPHAP